MLDMKKEHNVSGIDIENCVLLPWTSQLCGDTKFTFQQMPLHLNQIRWISLQDVVGQFGRPEGPLKISKITFVDIQLDKGKLIKWYLYNATYLRFSCPDLPY